MSVPIVEILGEFWELPDPDLADRWSRCIRPDVADGRRLDARTPYHWTSAATVQSILARAGEWLMFHAAGVSARDGAVVALIGPSGTGKSTAARTLCRTDFGYVTDETVAVLPDGGVVPFPKPISVVPTDGGVKRELGPDELGLRESPAQLRIGGLALLERRHGLVEPSIERLGLLEGIVAAVSEMSALPRVPTALVRVAELVEQSGGIHRIVYGDAEQLADHVRLVLAAEPALSGFVHHPPAPVTETTGWARGEYRDAIELDGEVLILQDSTCILLQGVGALAWLIAEEAVSFAALRETVIEAAGAHPDAENLVRKAVDELVAVGVMKAQ